MFRVAFDRSVILQISVMAASKKRKQGFGYVDQATVIPESFFNLGGYLKKFFFTFVFIAVSSTSHAYTEYYTQSGLTPFTWYRLYFTVYLINPFHITYYPGFDSPEYSTINGPVGVFINAPCDASGTVIVGLTTASLTSFDFQFVFIADTWSMSVDEISSLVSLNSDFYPDYVPPSTVGNDVISFFENVSSIADTLLTGLFEGMIGVLSLIGIFTGFRLVRGSLKMI
jgi:hypothetical protein